MRAVAPHTTTSSNGYRNSPTSGIRSWYLPVITGPLTGISIMTGNAIRKDMKGRFIRVMGKGDKERILPFSSRTGKAIWRYLATRENDHLGDPLFARRDNLPFDKNSLLKVFRVIGNRAGVRGVNIHRFRHTFAINFLRNGGAPWSLQMMLGHATLEMVKNYLALANADLQKNHRIASPVDHWRL